MPKKIRNKKEENIGRVCCLTCLKLYQTSHGGFPNDEDFLPFVIVGIIKGGYLIESNAGNLYRVKTKDIYLIK